MSELIAIMQGNAPLLVAGGSALWYVVTLLHKLDKRLIRVETKLEKMDS
jgi:hypothetical protein